jgi:hypothetical protein
MSFRTEPVTVDGTAVRARVDDDEILELLSCPFCDGMDVRTRSDWEFKCGDWRALRGVAVRRRGNHW